MKSKVIQGNNIDILKTYPDNYFDSIVTDPPYGIEFLHKDWDKNTGAVETWAECFRVLKPGGYILAFSAARTYHNLATNIESVGFEIRDQLMWLYASGFPKAQDVGKAIDKRGIDNNHHGWKTALKPAHEPIVMARKPFKGSCVDNVLENGVGALNIDATRIPFVDNKDIKSAKFGRPSDNNYQYIDTEAQKTRDNKNVVEANEQGRFPSNVLGEVTDYQKFFYCPKVSRAERHCGFETKDIPTTSGGMYDDHGTGKMYSIGTDMNSKKGIYTTGDAMRELGGRWENQKTAAGIKAVAVDKDGNTIPQVTLQAMVESKGSGNNHPTVKPVALMKYLIKLVTPQGGKILDPFTGSGSTGMAAVELDYDFTGCELDSDYVNIANNRITAWKNKTDLDNNPLPEEWFEEE